MTHSAGLSAISILSVLELEQRGYCQVLYQPCNLRLYEKIKYLKVNLTETSAVWYTGNSTFIFCKLWMAWLRPIGSLNRSKDDCLKTETWKAPLSGTTSLSDLKGKLAHLSRCQALILSFSLWWILHIDMLEKDHGLKEGRWDPHFPASPSLKSLCWLFALLCLKRLIKESLKRDCFQWKHRLSACLLWFSL